MKRWSCIMQIGIRIGVHVILVFPMLIQGYLPFEANVRSSVHGKILRDGLVYLRHLLQSSPDSKERLRAVLRYEDDLYRGLALADYEAGTMSILRQQLPRNELSHFFNPTTDTGYQLGKKIAWIRRLERHGWLSKGISMLLGPTVPATEMVDWYYSRAIKMATKNMTSSLESLGYAAHIIMDSTVPHHSSDCGVENSVCGHRRYETYVEGNYDTWNFTSFDDSYGAGLMNIREIQDLASEAAGAIVRYGALQSQALLYMVNGKAPETMMDEAGKNLIPLAQQLVATLMLMFVSDLNQPEQAQEAVVLQILSVELDGKWSEKSSPADFRPFVSYDQNPYHEVRGYYSNSNFVYTDMMVNPHAWTYVQVIGKGNIIEQRNVSFHLEIHDVFAEKCGSKCGKSQRKLLVASGGQTSIEIAIPLDNTSRDFFVEGTSTGCDKVQLEMDQCLNAVKVIWRIGHSSLMKGNTDLRESSFKSFDDFITPHGLTTIVVSILLLSCVCVGMLCLLWKHISLQTFWKQKKTRHFNQNQDSSQYDAKVTHCSDSGEVTPDLKYEIPRGMGNRYSELEQNLQNGLPIGAESELYATKSFRPSQQGWSENPDNDPPPQSSQMGWSSQHDNYQAELQYSQFERSPYHEAHDPDLQSSQMGWSPHRQGHERQQQQLSQMGWDQHQNHHDNELDRQSSQMGWSPHHQDHEQQQQHLSQIGWDQHQHHLDNELDLRSSRMGWSPYRQDHEQQQQLPHMDWDQHQQGKEIDLQSSQMGWYPHHQDREQKQQQLSRMGWDQHHHDNDHEQQTSQMGWRDQAQRPNMPQTANRGPGAISQLSLRSQESVLTEEERDQFPSIPTFGIDNGYNRFHAPYSDEAFNAEVDVTHGASLRRSPLPTRRRSTTSSNHGLSVESTSDESRIRDGSSHMSSRQSASHMSNRPATGSVNYYGVRRNSSPSEGHAPPIVYHHPGTLTNNGNVRIGHLRQEFEKPTERPQMIGDPSEEVRPEIAVLERWEMLDDDTIPEAPPMPYPLNLDSDLTGQNIFCAHIPRPLPPPHQYW